ncbi:disease resistance protein [Gossypium australe]|uniref:Disease resistance protein n=1 Tax=Gossypium australe TaxID=47621 RepID=A0A5B6VTZ6_9ROSI|nr:disease resistance protein [Gossypium australe]
MGRLDVVIWSTVSKEMSIAKLQKDIASQIKEMSIAKLQKDIASQIKVTFCGDECETRRARMLLEALSPKRRPEVSLDKVGIPKSSTGSKLVSTKRSFDVYRKMSCRAIKVKPLVKEESWKLFSEKQQSKGKMGEICKLESKVRASSFFSHGFLVNNVGKKEEVEELLEKGRFLDALDVDDVLWIGQVLPTSSLVVDTVEFKKN